MKPVFLFFLFILSAIFTNAQDTDDAAKPPVKKPSTTPTAKADSSVTRHEMIIKGQRIQYKAVAGTEPLVDEDGKAMASIFYTYYERTDVSNRNARPLIISFNGGPGSASVWMHIAYTGPKVLNIDDEGFPVQPYGTKDNPNSLLDIADIVFVDPVNTGFSRISNKEVPRSKFFGVNADIKYLADWLNTFVGHYNRWTSPKFLIGESYGTTRVSGLALELQNTQWMYLNGVILVSPTYLGIDRGGPVEVANRLPYFAATAWYHKMLPADLQQKDLTDMLPEVESFTINELIPALAKGSMLDDAKRKDIAAKMSRYSGMSAKSILDHNLVVSTSFFWKELLRDKGYTLGRLDSRYLGIDEQDAGDSPDYNAELTSWLHSFTPAINAYLRQDLNYKTDLKYNMFGPVHPWDNNGDNTGANLRSAMAENPYLHLMIQSGYYDGSICDFFDAKYSMWHIDPSGRMNNRMTWKGYRSGHMMYLRKPDLVTATEDLREFIKNALPKDKSAKY
ncbi:MAG: carboxypeptidase [Chitinophagaceae bacterium]|nr:carboxypeptidase [Chitinophagaceae bacterium]